MGRFLCYLYVAGIGFPLFILPGYRTTNWTLIFHPEAPASLDRQALRIHWVVGLGAIVAAYFLIRYVVRRRIEVPPRGRLVAGLGVVFFLSLAAGLATSPNRLSVLYFLQTVVPFVGFLVGVSLTNSIASLRRLVVVLVAVVTFSVVCISLLALSFGAIAGEVGAANRLAKAIPQFRDYFPYVAATSLSLALGLSRSLRRTGQKALVAVAIVVHLAFYSLSWSRMGLIMFVVVMIAPLVLTRPTRRAQWIGRAVTAALLLSAVAALVVQTSYAWRRLQFFTDGTVQSDQRRLQYALTALRMVAEEPLFGRRFRTDWDVRVTGDRTEPLRIPRVFLAHNQYLDYGIRAGVPAMLLLGAIMWIVTGDLRRVLRFSENEPALRPIVVGIAGALLAVSVGNLTQLFLVQAQTGSLAWLLVGITARLAQMAGQEVPRTARLDGYDRYSPCSDR